MDFDQPPVQWFSALSSSLTLNIVGVAEPIPTVIVPPVTQSQEYAFDQPPVSWFTWHTPSHLIQIIEPIQQIVSNQASLFQFQPPIPPPIRPEYSYRVHFAQPEPFPIAISPYVQQWTPPAFALESHPFDYIAVLRMIASAPHPINTPLPPPPLVTCGIPVSALTQTIWTRLNDDGTYYNRDWVLRVLNITQNLWVLLTFCIERVAVVPLTADQPFYSILNDFGIQDFLKPLRATYNGQRIRTATLNELSRYGNWRNTPGPPTRYYQQGIDQFAIYPQPTSSMPLTLELTYAGHPIQLANQFDIPEIQEENHPYLADGATYILKIFEGLTEMKIFEEFFARYWENAGKYAAYIRARSKAQNYDEIPPFDLATFDRGRVMGSLMAAEMAGQQKGRRSQ